MTEENDGSERVHWKLKTSMLLLFLGIGFGLGYGVGTSEADNRVEQEVAQVEETYKELVQAYKDKLDEVLPHK